MKKRVLIVILALILVPLTGCTTSGIFSSTNITNVQLSQSNFVMKAKNVKGEAEAGYILGFSGAFRGEMQTWALIKVDGDAQLYEKAIENLWENFERQEGSPIEGRSLALINVRYDSDALNVFGLYTKPKISVRADIIEFK